MLTVAWTRGFYPQGGGTALDYGGRPRRPGVAIVAVSRLLPGDRPYPAADMTITIEAGICATALQSVLAGQNQRCLSMHHPGPIAETPRQRVRHQQQTTAPPAGGRRYPRSINIQRQLRLT